MTISEARSDDSIAFHERAHALDNHLAAIRLYSDLLSQDLAPETSAEGAARRDDVAAIRSAADRAIEISRGLFGDIWLELDRLGARA
jgi:hypothetical protein